MSGPLDDWQRRMVTRLTRSGPQVLNDPDADSAALSEALASAALLEPATLRAEERNLRLAVLASGPEHPGMSRALRCLSLAPADTDLATAADPPATLHHLADLEGIRRALPSRAAHLRRVIERNTAWASMEPDAVTPALADEAEVLADAVPPQEDSPLAELLDALTEAPHAAPALTPVQITAGLQRARQALFGPPVLAWARRHRPSNTLRHAIDQLADHAVRLAAATSPTSWTPVTLETRRDGEEEVLLLLEPSLSKARLAWAGPDRPPQTARQLPSLALMPAVQSPVPDLSTWDFSPVPETTGVRLEWPDTH